MEVENTKLFMLFFIKIYLLFIDRMLKSKYDNFWLLIC